MDSKSNPPRRRGPIALVQTSPQNRAARRRAAAERRAGKAASAERKARTHAFDRLAPRNDVPGGTGRTLPGTGTIANVVSQIALPRRTP
jgi:hypothetical protein